MRIEMAHLQAQGINFAVFAADANDRTNAVASGCSASWWQRRAATTCASKGGALWVCRQCDRADFTEDWLALGLFMPKLEKPRHFETVSAQYTTTEIIGQGGTGTVFKASDDCGGGCGYQAARSVKGNSRETSQIYTKTSSRSVNATGMRTLLPLLTMASTAMGRNQPPFYVMPLYQESLPGTKD